MNLLDLLSLKSAAEGVSLNSPVDVVMPILRKFGFNDDELAAKVLMAAQLVSSDPSESVLNFVQNGGVIRLLAGVAPQADDDVILECPHCTEMIII